MSNFWQMAFWKIRSTVFDLKFDYFFQLAKKRDLHHFLEFSNHRPKTRSSLDKLGHFFTKNFRVNFRSDDILEEGKGQRSPKRK